MSTEKSVTKESTKAVMQQVAKNGNMSSLNSQQIGTVFEGYKAAIAQALPRHLTADRVIQMVTTLISRNSELKKCSASSLIGAVMQASILGFRPVEALGHCYFVPYNNNVGTRDNPKWEKQVQFQIGYKGYMELGRRSNQIKSIHAFAVYKGDDFNYQLGLNPIIHHIPNDKDQRPEDLTHTYAVAHYKDGGYNFVVLTRKQIEGYRLRNKVQKAEPSQAWKTDYEKMAKAKALKQLATFMPLSDEVQLAVAADEATIRVNDFAQDMSGQLVDIEVPFEDVTNTSNGESQDDSGEQSSEEEQE